VSIARLHAIISQVCWILPHSPTLGGGYMSSVNNRSIRNYLIEPMTQFRMGLRLILIALCFFVAAIYFIADGFFIQYSHLINMTTQNNEAPMALNAIMDAFYRHASITVGLCVAFPIVMMVAIIYFTHRIYGAVVNIRGFISELNAGNYHKRCQLRKTDELQDVAEALNNLAETLEKGKSRS
jgi:hypothetical protein